jgi:hypothetical protein
LIARRAFAEDALDREGAKPEAHDHHVSTLEQDAMTGMNTWIWDAADAGPDSPPRLILRSLPGWWRRAGLATPRPCPAVAGDDHAAGIDHRQRFPCSGPDPDRQSRGLSAARHIGSVRPGYAFDGAIQFNSAE